MKKLLLLTSCLAGVAIANAEDAAFQLSLTPDIAIYPKTT